MKTHNMRNKEIVEDESFINVTEDDTTGLDQESSLLFNVKRIWD